MGSVGEEASENAEDSAVEQQIESLCACVDIDSNSSSNKNVTKILIVSLTLRLSISSRRECSQLNYFDTKNQRRHLTGV